MQLSLLCKVLMLCIFRIMHLPVPWHSSNCAVRMSVQIWRGSGANELIRCHCKLDWIRNATRLNNTGFAFSLAIKKLSPNLSFRRCLSHGAFLRSLQLSRDEEGLPWYFNHYKLVFPTIYLVWVFKSHCTYTLFTLMNALFYLAQWILNKVLTLCPLWFFIVCDVHTTFIMWSLLSRIHKMHTGGVFTESKNRKRVSFSHTHQISKHQTKALAWSLTLALAFLLYSSSVWRDFGAYTNLDLTIKRTTDILCKKKIPFLNYSQCVVDKILQSDTVFSWSSCVVFHLVREMGSYFGSG